MIFKKSQSTFLTTFLLLFFFSSALADQNTIADKICSKLSQANSFIQSASGDDNWKEKFNKIEGDFFWKGNYVLPIDIASKSYAAHPYSKALIGLDMTILKCKKTGKSFFEEILKVPQRSNGSWIEYWWTMPNKNPSEYFRKVICVKPVKDTNFLVVAGFYDETVSLQELNDLCGFVAIPPQVEEKVVQPVENIPENTVKQKETIDVESSESDTTKINNEKSEVIAQKEEEKKPQVARKITFAQEDDTEQPE